MKRNNVDEVRDLGEGKGVMGGRFLVILGKRRSAAGNADSTGFMARLNGLPRGHPMEMLRTKLREPVGSLSGPFAVGVALVEQSEGGLGVVVGGGVRAAVAPGADCQM